MLRRPSAWGKACTRYRNYPVIRRSRMPNRRRAGLLDNGTCDPRTLNPERSPSLYNSSPRRCTRPGIALFHWDTSRTSPMSRRRRSPRTFPRSATCPSQRKRFPEEHPSLRQSGSLLESRPFRSVQTQSLQQRGWTATAHRSRHSAGGHAAIRLRRHANRIHTRNGRTGRVGLH